MTTDGRSHAAAALGCALVLAGCPWETGSSPDNSPETCRALAAEWEAIVQGIQTCGPWDECTTVGGGGCACSPMIGCGRPVNREAYRRSRARQIEEDFYERRCLEPAWCDCSGNPEAECQSGVCVAVAPYCPGPPPRVDATVYERRDGGKGGPQFQGFPPP